MGLQRARRDWQLNMSFRHWKYMDSNALKMHGVKCTCKILTTFLLLKFLECIKAAATAAKSLQSCPTLCDPIDVSPPGSPVPGVLQARTLEWVAISFSSGLKLTMVYTRSGDGINCTLLACFCFQWGKLYFFSQEKKKRKKKKIQKTGLF